MRFASLGSGSRGNATLVEAGGTRVLIDCGFAAREAERRLDRLGVDASTLDAIVVTHEHGDHIRGVGALSRRFGIPTWMTSGTYNRSDCGDLARLHLFNSHGQRLRIGDFDVFPYPVPHDAREPCQFVVRGGGSRLGLLTDAGAVTQHIVATLRDCDALVLECNHDARMLREGPYPPRLQARVGGDLGHLGNHQAAGLLRRLDHGRLRHVVAAHLSEKNNTPELAREALLTAAPTLEERLSLGYQGMPSGWLEL